MIPREVEGKNVKEKHMTSFVEALELFITFDTSAVGLLFVDYVVILSLFKKMFAGLISDSFFLSCVTD